jgi:succinate-semialdehyde dehydrogenase / glutarate-semialdehyde dehydrogenase
MVPDAAIRSVNLEPVVRRGPTLGRMSASAETVPAEVQHTDRSRLPFDAGRLAARLSATGPTLAWESPFDGGLTFDLPSSTAEDIAAAGERARAAQPTWAARSFAQRAEVLLEFHDRLLDRLEDFADLVQYDAGKARLSAIEEVLHAALSARYNALAAERHLGSRRGLGLVPGLTRIDRHYRPKGLVGVIAPWNYPLTMAISDGLAALAAGNAVLLKPDRQTPFSALAAVALLTECGLPSDLWQIVNGSGHAVGPELIAAVDYLCFTGSSQTGRTVAAQCAEQLIGCSLELGGKNPLLVLADAHVERAAAGAVRACFSNAGQLCVATERLYVEEAVYEEFVAAFVAKARALRLGHSTDYLYEVGGLMNRGQLERVEGHVEDARNRGAEVLTGGRVRPDLGPLFYEPTVLTGVTPDMACFAEETFGPVVSVYRVRDAAAAIALANDSEYGLNASVWTADPARGREVAAQLQCGTVNVNEGFAATFGSLDAPMGGMKNSGIGRRQGATGLLRFVEEQSVATQHGLPLAPSLGLAPKTFVRGFTGALRLFRRLNRLG